MAPPAQQRRHTRNSKKSNIPHTQPPPSSRPPSSPSSSPTLLLPLLLLSSLLLAALLFFALPKFPAPRSHRLSVYDRGLVTTQLSYKDALSDAGRAWINRTYRHMNSSVLGYVTPWNSKGYDMAKMFREKFTHISPVWYQLKREGEDLQLLGQHDVDLEWIDKVRINGQPLILPRVVLEGFPLDTMLVQKEERRRAVNIISSECKSMEYDGIVLEAWSGWAVSGILENAILRQKAMQFVRELGSSLHKVGVSNHHHLQLIFVIPPPNPKKADLNQFTPADMAMLDDTVDGFSLMTYDFSNIYRPGPSAPLPWVHLCLHLLLGKSSKKGVNHVSEQELQGGGDGQEATNIAPKLLMGVNFYGNDFLLSQGAESIVGHQYLFLLRKYKPKIIWDNESKEHYFEYTDETKKHRVYYPSLKSLALRLHEAQLWGAGVSIWEIGQGLEYFFDLL